MELISYVALLWASFERLVVGIPRFLIFATAAYVILYFATLGLGRWGASALVARRLVSAACSTGSFHWPY